MTPFLQKAQNPSKVLKHIFLSPYLPRYKPKGLKDLTNTASLGHKPEPIFIFISIKMYTHADHTLVRHRSKPGSPSKEHVCRVLSFFP